MDFKLSGQTGTNDKITREEIVKELRNFWPVQEIFFDPLAACENKIPENLNLHIKTSVYGKKQDEKIYRVTVEIFGSLTKGKHQFGNIRFVNISIHQTDRLSERRKEELVKEKVEELLSFLPFYLLKCGIFVEKINL